MKNTPRFELPTLLAFDGKGGFKPGRGEAGWTVYYFETAEERRVFMQSHQVSRMPCWSRIPASERDLGSELATYARLTAADCSATLSEAIGMMRDEPGEVARALDCSADDVIGWCRNVS